MDRISRHSRGEDVWFGNFRDAILFFADDVVLLAFSSQELQRTLERFAAGCEVAGMKVSSSKYKAMVLNWKKVECSLRVGDKSLLQAEEFKYLGTLFTSDSRLERQMDR